MSDRKGLVELSEARRLLEAPGLTPGPWVVETDGPEETYPDYSWPWRIVASGFEEVVLAEFEPAAPHADAALMAAAPRLLATVIALWRERSTSGDLVNNCGGGQQTVVGSTTGDPPNDC